MNRKENLEKVVDLKQAGSVQAFQVISHGLMRSPNPVKDFFRGARLFAALTVNRGRLC